MLASEKSAAHLFLRRLRSYALNQGRFMLRRIAIPALMKLVLLFRPQKEVN